LMSLYMPSSSSLNACDTIRESMCLEHWDRIPRTLFLSLQ
jgi:hypothetical protein